MQTKGCKPDSVTYGGLIMAYHNAGQWRQAFAAFERMSSHSCRPDGVVYNSIVGLLWETGIVWAQAKAMQVGLLQEQSLCCMLPPPSVRMSCLETKSISCWCRCVTLLGQCLQACQLSMCMHTASI